MKMKQRALSILLSMVMVLTFMPAIAFAEPDDGSDPEERGEMTKLVLSHQGTYESEGYNDCDGYWDEAAEDWIPTSEPYLMFDAPDLEENDIIYITYEGDDTPVEYHAVMDDESECVSMFAAVNDEEDTIYPCTEWVNEQTFDNPFTVGTKEDFIVYIWIDENRRVTDTAEASLVDREEDPDDGDEGDDDDPFEDDEMEFGDLPEDLSTITRITLNVPVDVTVTNDAKVATFKFVPQTTGVYVFESLSDDPEVDPQGRVRTEEKVIAEMDDPDDEEDDEETINCHFQIIFDGVKGETYYLQAKVYEDIDLENPYPATFRVKVYDSGEDWQAINENNVIYEYDGQDPVTLKVKVLGKSEGLSFNWYRSNDQLIKENGTAEQEVSEFGDFYCMVSDGTKNVKVNFCVDLIPVDQGTLRFVAIDAGTCHVEALWPDDAEGACLAKGSVSIPASVKFADGKTRSVTCIDNFYDAKELTSVAIPSSVKTIEEDAFMNTGLKSITIPATVTSIGMHALGYTGSYNNNDEQITKVPGFTIFGKTGSAAQTYAKANGIAFRDPAAEAAARAKAAEDARQGTQVAGMPKVKLKKPSAKKSSIKVQWTKLDKKKLKKSGATNYEIWVSTSASFPKGAQTKEYIVKKSKSSVNVKGLAKKTKYFVRIRAIKYSGGKKLTGPWKQKSVKTKKK